MYTMWEIIHGNAYIGSNSLIPNQERNYIYLQLALYYCDNTSRYMFAYHTYRICILFDLKLKVVYAI